MGVCIMSDTKKISNDLANEISKVVSKNMKQMLSTSISHLAKGRHPLEVDLGNVGTKDDYRDIYKEGGGHNEVYKDNYSETGYKEKYSDTRSNIMSRIRPDDYTFTREDLLLEARRLRSELAEKDLIINKLKNNIK